MEKMKMKRSALVLVACLAQTLFLILLTGCGAGTSIASDSGPISETAGMMSGKLHGGLNPIVGATVTLYVTANNGYGGAAVSAATATTDSNGGFTFVLPSNFSCPSGQFAYATSYSGNTGSNSTNNNSLLMIPIGACAANYSGQTYTGPFLWMNELTTVASAYALGNFMTIINSGSSPVVNISAPANNNSASPCISNGSTCATTAAGGLPHAFANALSLVNIATGQPNTTNSHSGVLPAAEINLLGSIMQACVNSSGVTGSNSATSNDGSSCGKLFSLTTPPYSGATTPATTLQAIIDLAKYPNPQIATWSSTCTAAGSGTTTSTSCLFGLATGVGAAYPSALASAPPDWALAVVYPKGAGAVTGAACSGTCPGLTYPYDLALDISDSVYVTNNNSSAQTWANVVAFAYDGTPLWSNAEDTINNNIKNIATDGIGHVITADNGHGTTAGANGQFIKVLNSTTGALLTTITAAQGYPYCVITDPFNNIWFGVAYPAVTNLYEISYTGTVGNIPQYSPVSFTSQPVAAQNLYQISIDQNLNVWAVGSTSTNAAAYMFPNTGTVAAPTYTGTLKSVSTTSATISGANYSVGMAPDGQGNAWMTTFSGLIQIQTSGSGNASALTAVAPVTVGDNGARFVEVDSARTVYVGDYANGTAVGGVVAYDTVHSLSLGVYKGCLLNGNACGTTSTNAAVYGGRGVAIDSSGDIWVGSSVTGALAEFIGTGAPTWPALSLANFSAPQ
jgi:hypothetical protein